MRIKNKGMLYAGIAAIGVCTALQGRGQATDKMVADSTRKYFDRLLASSDTADKELLSRELSKLVGGNNEQLMDLAAQYYYQMNNANAADSVLKLEVKRYPNGLQARRTEQSAIYESQDAETMERAFKKWLAKFPPDHFRTGEIDEEILYDYARSAIAIAYARKKNVSKAIAYENMLKADFWKGNAYAGLSNAFYATGDIANAEIYARKAMENAAEYIDGKKGDSNAAKFAASAYSGLTSTYANILYEQHRYAEALKYIEIAYKGSSELNAGVNVRYASILECLDRNQEAFAKLEQVVKAGLASEEVKRDFRRLYVKTRGSDAGFAEYEGAIKDKVSSDLRKKLANDMVKEPAANFTLMDLSGQKVSLADYKGRVVVLDFWATWCGPCKASFPAMQMAVDKYKEDNDVKFLFIDTWERSESPAEEVSRYLSSVSYTFRILLDLKDPDTRINKVVSDYKVYGIPAKFVIDGQGYIRFKLTGFNGSSEAAVDELSMMIDFAKKGGT